MVELASVRRCLAVSAVVIGLILAGPAAPGGAAAAWSVVSSPNIGANANVLYGVSCATAKSCRAVGFYTSPGVNRTLAESWNGKAWTVSPSPNLGGVWNVLYGVSCASPVACMAVGTYKNDSGVNRTLAESWNGKAWAIVASPNRGTAGNALSGVSCVSAASCIAVGGWSASGVNRTLIESWNGTAWSVVKTSPNPGKAFNTLSGVSCASANSCKAVGKYFVGAVALTLVESWNGKTWTVAPSPNAGTEANLLSAVSCVSAVSCKAVGEYTAAGVDLTLVESWNGKTWAIAPSPNDGANPSLLSGVSCFSATACQAVGNSAAGTVDRTLVETWNGTAWTITPSPNPTTGSAADLNGVTGSALEGVDCVSSTACKAVGLHVNLAGVDRTLVESHA